MRPQGPWAAGPAALLLLAGVLASDALLSTRGRKKVVHVMGEWGRGSAAGSWAGPPWNGTGEPSCSPQAVGFNIR